MKKISVYTLVTLLLLSLTSGLSQSVTSGEWTYTLQPPSGLLYFPHPQQGAFITTYHGAGGAVSVPSQIDGYSVVGFGLRGIAMFEQTSVSSVSIPDSVLFIGEGALATFNNSGTTTVWIGAGVTFIEEMTFVMNTRLTRVDVDSRNTRYTSVDGVLFDKTSDTLVAYPAKRAGTSYSIPNGVATIGVLSFYGSGALESVSLPSGIATIMEGAFWSCTSLKSITIPSSVVLIKYDAFHQCTNLTSAFFLGNAPNTSFTFPNQGTVYFISGSTGWGVTYSGWPTYMIGTELDADGDGLNDLAEFKMSALGFDWQLNQLTLVSALYSNANLAHLFTQSQFDANRTAGRQDVLSDPASHNLYTSDSIMDLRMGGLMLQKQGSNAIVTFQPQTTTDLATQPFTNNGTPVTNTIPMPGNKGFIRINAKP